VSGPAYFVVFYEVVDDFVTRRAPHRDAHLALARESQARGELQLGGALGDPADRALIVFRAADRAVVEEFVRRDPYVTAGLVRRWEIRPWAVAVGG